ncbi:MAG TPA: L,D-transpeptidase [Vicinamibacterales bacterium]|nr:L,D-transpeptidase [Vicinamibacterales bacterium]
MRIKRIKTQTVPSILLVSCSVFAAVTIPAQAQQSRRPAAAHKHVTKKPATPPIDERALKTQVMLDRAGYSPGEISGHMNASTQKALAVFTKYGGNGAALPSDEIATYTLTDQDVAGPFTPDIPRSMMDQATLDALDYRNVEEKLGEKFHCSPTLLKDLNPSAKFVADEEIKIPNVVNDVAPVGPPRGSQSDTSNPAVTTVKVSKSESDLIVTDGASHILMYAPVTSGSEHDPLPLGEWKVTGVQHNPKFHYNPQLFWDAKATDRKTTIQPGPNNPVGVVWIDLSRPHYGLHGTPEPSLIGKTTSHGCVRLTNWDAEKLAGLVRPGTKVVFTE